MESTEDLSTSFEYAQDPEYDGPAYPSLPMHCRRGISYTPPGWMRVYNNKQKQAPKSKREIPEISLDALFE